MYANVLADNLTCKSSLTFSNSLVTSSTVCCLLRPKMEAGFPLFLMLINSRFGTILPYPIMHNMANKFELNINFPNPAKIFALDPIEVAFLWSTSLVLIKLGIQGSALRMLVTLLPQCKHWDPVSGPRSCEPVWNLNIMNLINRDVFKNKREII